MDKAPRRGGLSRSAELATLMMPAAALLLVVAAPRVRVEPLAAAPLATVARYGVHPTPHTPHPVLRVCADPNNLPFSDSLGGGFENRIAELVAREMGARVEYTWWAQRRGFWRNTVKAGRCDVVVGLPTGYGPALTTRPYYRSTYVFVTRRAAPAVRSFDDPALRTARVGVHLVGDDYANTPPVDALARRGIVNNVRGYMIYGDYRTPAPPSQLVRAVARGDVDVAVAWGPMAGYFARRQRVPLRLVPVSPASDGPAVPLTFDIAMGVRRDHAALRDTLDAILGRRRAEVARILDAYGVPRVDMSSTRVTADVR
ncbi:MAG TPA: substrate-binding domain-containing protein [Gemmatimonadaceae bacterium]|nr:substrate-binding domain-containing protein [Gemmatimonadaceae bacterium]